MSNKKIDVVILISAHTEWREVKRYFPNRTMSKSPFGEWFSEDLVENKTTLFFQSGWGKIPAASSTQYVIDHWHPELIINIGTCGGFQAPTLIHEHFEPFRAQILKELTLVSEGRTDNKSIC